MARWLARELYSWLHVLVLQSTVVLSLAALALPGAQDDVRDEVPLQPGKDLPLSVQTSAGHLEPRPGGWTREDLAADVNGALKEIAHFLEGEGNEASLRAIASDSLLSVCWLPARRADAERDLPVDYEVSAQSELAAALGQDALVAGLVTLREGFGAGSLDVHFKILGTHGTQESLTTPLRMEVRAAGGAGRTGWVAHIKCSWTSTESGLQLTLFELQDYERTAASAIGFVDRTAAVLPLDMLRDQLRPGIDSWREQIDAYLGVGVLGHHGLCVADVNQDGLEDIYLCQPGGLPNRLLLRQPDGTYRDVSHQAGVDLLDPSSSALLVDLDRDGDPDLVVVVGDELIFMENRGAGLYRARSRHEAVSVTSISAADVDLDGDLDLYACAYLSPYDGQAFPVPYHEAQNGQRNLLLLNDGEFSFKDQTSAMGLDAGNHAFSFAAAWEDFDIDGDPDLYVANDFGSNNLYRNDGGVFVDVAQAMGVADVGAGMGVDWADVDGDGWMDLHVSNMFSSAGQRVASQADFQPQASAAQRSDLQRHARGNSLFLNQAGQGFRDATEQAGVGMGRWAWGGVFMEYDNDGRPDIFVPNGFVTGSGPGDL